MKKKSRISAKAKVTRTPYALWPAGPLGWSSHLQIFPVLKSTLRQGGIDHFQKTWTPNPLISKDFICRLKAKASCLVVPPARDSEDLTLLANLRNKHHLSTPIIKMFTGDMTIGGHPVMRYQKLFRSYDHFVTNSTPEQRLFQMAFPSHSNIHRIPLAVDHTVYKPQSSSAVRKFRKNLGLTQKDKMLVYVGRLNLEKNIHGLLFVFSEVLKKSPNSHLYLIGQIDDLGLAHFGKPLQQRYRHILVELLQQYRIEKNVHFVGQKNSGDLQQYFTACDAQISLTLKLTEDFGYAIAEGMSCGAPTLVTAWGGGVDYVDSGAAIGVPVHQTLNGPYIDYAAAIQNTLTLIHNRKHWGQKALKYAKQNLHQKPVSKRWKALLTSTVSKGILRSKPLKPAHIFLQFYLARMSQQQLLEKAFQKHGLGALEKIFKNPKHPLYLAILRIYAQSQLPIIGDSEFVQLHPFFSLKSFELTDPMAIRTSITLSKSEKQHLHRIFGTKWQSKVSKKRFQSSKLLSKLIAQGFVLISKNFEYTAAYGKKESKAKKNAR